jgi:hypothetical protein
MRTKATVLVLTLVAASALMGAPARASIERKLEQARARHRAALDRVDALSGQLDVMLAHYDRVERRTGRAAIRLVERSRAADAARAAVADAHSRLVDRVRTTYELGPGTLLQAFLSVRTFADLSTAHEYTSRTLAFDARVVKALRRAEQNFADRRRAAELATRRLWAQRRNLRTLLGAMRRKLNEARRIADRFGLVVQRLEAQQQAIEDAAARQSSLGVLGTGATGADQSALLALLGPSGGRTCGTPDGLTDTGQSFSGNASWYGWEFAGQTTASGAIFDPRLFTAANRWLPFGTFLRVHYGGKCAIVLVNDRGPYAGDRVIDLSMAAAQYLGVGVSYVTADILVPTHGLPG